MENLEETERFENACNNDNVVISNDFETKYSKSEYFAIIDTLRFFKQLFCMYESVVLDWADLLEDKDRQENLVSRNSISGEYRIAFIAQNMPFRKGACKECMEKIEETISDTLDFIELSVDIPYRAIYEKLLACKKEIEKFEIYEKIINEYVEEFMSFDAYSEEEIHKSRERYFNSFHITQAFAVIKSLQEFIDYIGEESRNSFCNIVDGKYILVE